PHPDAIRPSPQLAWAGRHFVVNKLPGAARRAARGDFAYIDELLTRWAPDWSGPAREETLERVRACFADPANAEHAFAYYRDLSPRPDAALAPPLRVPGLIVADDTPYLADGYQGTVDRFEPRAELVVLEGTGHWPHREDESRFLEALLTFLDR
ncbi:MAG: alpha/beta hydrolase, partial [Actinomycetota bacterium]